MIKPSASDRSFGLLLCVFTGSAAIYAFWKVNVALALFLIMLTIAIAAMVILCPNKFIQLKNGWLWLGERLGAIFNPVVLAALYYIVLTPTALVSRWLGRDALRLKFQTRSTYWIKRQSSARSQSEFFRQQY